MRLAQLGYQRMNLMLGYYDYYSMPKLNYLEVPSCDLQYLFVVETMLGAYTMLVLAVVVANIVIGTPIEVGLHNADAYLVAPVLVLVVFLALAVYSFDIEDY